MFLINLIKRFRRGILLAFLLVVVEDVAWIVEPMLFGKLIDAVIDVQVSKNQISDSLNSTAKLLHYDSFAEKFKYPLKSLKIFYGNEDTVTPKYEPYYNEFVINTTYWLPLFLWVLFFLINSGVGTLRRIVDPRIFLNIYTKIATEVSELSIKLNLSTSKTAARAELSHQYISFVQYRAPEVIENIISIVGASIALYFFDLWISVTCLVIIIPLYFANKLYNTKVLGLQKIYHDNYEDMFDVFNKKNPRYVNHYFRRLAVPQRKIANWGALNFGIMRVTLLGIFLVVLYIAIDLDEFSAGELYSIVAYLWTFVTATEYLPELLEGWTSLKDISKRLREEG